MTSRPKMRLLTGNPGGGKSHTMRTEMVELPGLCAFALPSIRLLKEQEAKLRATAPRLALFPAHSDRSGRKMVQLQVEKHLKTISKMEIDHGVLLFTHDFLQTGDLSGLAGWRFYVDEPPSAIQAGKLSISRSSLKLWEAEFALTPIEHWGMLRRSADTPLRLGLERGDTILKDLAPLRRAAAGRNVVLFSTDRWAPGTHYWMTIWTPLDLPSPTQVTMAGAGYLRSLGAKVAAKLHDGVLAFEKQEIRRPRTGQPKVSIRYFADWECASPHWLTWAGLDDLKAISDYISRETPDLGYWSGNKVAKLVMSHRISRSQPHKARLAGLDGMMAHESCAFIYSSKASAHLTPVLDLLGLTKEEVRVSAEDEDIFQFVFRGAIRRLEFDGRYEVYLFSRQQAERLKPMLEAAGIDDVTLHYESSAGVAKEPPIKGKGAVIATDDEADP